MGWKVSINPIFCFNFAEGSLPAHRAAYDRLKILHRDVSAGNILIRHDGKEGFLIDWDFSKEVTDDESPRQRERTVWQSLEGLYMMLMCGFVGHLAVYVGTTAPRYIQTAHAW